MDSAEGNCKCVCGGGLAKNISSVSLWMYCVCSESYKSEPLLLAEEGSYRPKKDATCGGETTRLL